jgi:hypothetical protein
LRSLFLDLQTGMIAQLTTNRKNIAHPGTKGDASELRWLDVFRSYLPMRYQTEKAFVVDSKGNMSEQIDIIIFDRQYSPFLFNQDGALYVPAESVYAVIEVKQDLSKNNLEYAGAKAASVRSLHRTSAPIPHAGGVYPPKVHSPILASIVTLDSSWDPPLGDAFYSTITSLAGNECLDLGCALQCGAFEIQYNKKNDSRIDIGHQEEALIFFFLHLLSRLQQLGTVPMLEINEYSKSLHK